MKYLGLRFSLVRVQEIRYEIAVSDTYIYLPPSVHQYFCAVGSQGLFQRDLGTIRTQFSGERTQKTEAATSLKHHRTTGVNTE